MLKSHRVVVTDEPTRLTSEETNVGDANSILLKNLDDDVTVDIGGEHVSSGHGYPVEPGKPESMDLQGREAPYAVAPSGQEAVVAVFESGL